MIKTLLIAAVVSLGALHALPSGATDATPTRTASELASVLATEVAGDDIKRLRVALEARGLSEADAQATARQAVKRLFACLLDAAIAQDEAKGAPPGALLELLWQSYESDAPASETLRVFQDGELSLASEQAAPCMLNVGQELGVMDIL